MALYIQWDEENQTHVGVPSNAPGSEGLWLACIPPSAARTSAKQILKWSLLEGHEDYLHGYWEGSDDPLDEPATNNEIKLRHRELEQSPIAVFGNILDCDERSELRMRDALSTWDSRPVQPGMFEDLNGVRVIYWTLGNNSVVPIDKPTLQAFFDEMLTQRAIRGANLYRRYRELKSSGCTVRELHDLSTWE